jgi:RIO kinase 1
MKIPSRIEPLIQEGLVDSVICQLMSGKEAMLYVVQCGEEYLCAKVYKDKQKRNFRHNISYTEGRTTGGNHRRRHRIIRRNSNFGRAIQEDAWHSIEVDTMCRLTSANVSTPRFYNFFEGVLLMELITDSDGNVAPRMNQLTLSAEHARIYHAFLIEQIVRMLCSGIIHGDLSEYNILMSSRGPVIIDFPQAVYAASNNNAQMILKRDIHNITAFLSHFAPELAYTDYGTEIWSLYQNGKLNLSVNLTGHIEQKHKPVDLNGVLHAIDTAARKQAAWQRYKRERWTSTRTLSY